MAGGGAQSRASGGDKLDPANPGEWLLQAVGTPWPHPMVKYLVPYTVAGYSAARNELDRGQR